MLCCRIFNNLNTSVTTYVKFKGMVAFKSHKDEVDIKPVLWLLDYACHTI